MNGRAECGSGVWVFKWTTCVQFLCGKCCVDDLDWYL